jgi:hypothetical protein
MSVRDEFWKVTGQLIDDGFKGSCFELWKLAVGKCLDDGRYSLVIRYLHAEYDTATGNEHDALFKLINDRLLDIRNWQDLQRLWKSVVKIRKDRFFYALDHYREYKIPRERYVNLDQYKEFKEQLFVVIQGYCDVLSKIGGSESEFIKMSELRTLVEADKKPKAKPTSDKRKMDESVFWEVIAEARAAAEFSFEVPERLKEKLEAMNVTAIKKFDKLFRQKVASLYRWDLWALAYIMNGGCGDDAFEYFRAGLVIQGKEFYDLAFQNINALAEKLNAFDGDIECEQALNIAENAYSDKTGDFMPYQDVDMPDIQGEKWEEEDLPKNYPELCKIFSWAG